VRTRAASSACVLVCLLAGCSSARRATAPLPPPPRTTAAPVPSGATTSDRRAEFVRLERRFDARLGVYAVDTGSGRVVAHRADERFAYASTHKALAVGVLLQRTSASGLDEVVRYGREDLVAHSPVTERHVGAGLTLRELSDAAIRYSDNTAANLLLRELGGPEGLQAGLEAVGDDVTRVVRDEPALNEAAPGDDRDTSTPRALAQDLRAFAVDDALPADDRALLNGWLRGGTTGAGLVRAGVPEGWEVGDKTGSAAYGTRNDLAVVRPPGREPLVLAVMTRRDEQDAERRDALVAAAAEVVVEALDP